MNYTIQPGDTLGKIAATHRVTLSALLDANPQCKANPNAISVGDTIVIPDGDEQPIADRNEPVPETSSADWLGIISASTRREGGDAVPYRAASAMRAVSRMARTR
jgi:LysM domain-containing protein